MTALIRDVPVGMEQSGGILVIFWRLSQQNLEWIWDMGEKEESRMSLGSWAEQPEH